MNRFRYYLGVFLDNVMKVLGWLVILLFAAMGIFLMLMVFTRYLLGFSMHWVEAFSRYSLIWISFLGSALALRKAGHIGMDALVERFPEKVRHFVDTIVTILIGFFSFFILWQSFTLLRVASRQIIPALQIKMHYIYMVIPFTALMFLLITLEHLLKGKNE